MGQVRLRLRLAFAHRHLAVAAGLATGLGVLAGFVGNISALHVPSPLAPTAAHADNTFDNALFNLFNQDRAAKGLPALRWSSTLSGLAETGSYSGCGYSIAGRAEDMVRRNYMSHTILNCGSQTVFDILRADGVAFDEASENLGYTSGVSDPNAAAQWMNNQFMNSPEHAGNILDPNANVTGIGSWWTASGQTWSGAGSAQSNVLVAAAEFIQAPNPPAASAPPPPPPPSQPAPPSRPRPAASSAPAHSELHPVIPPPPATRRPAPAVPEVVAVAVLPGTAVAAGDAPAVVTAGAPPVAAASGSNAPPMRLEVTCAGVLLAGLGSLRRRLSSRRRRTATT